MFKILQILSILIAVKLIRSEMINLSGNDGKILISPYSKVSHVGSGDPDSAGGNEGRSLSSNGHILWTHSTTRALNRTQNPRTFVQKARKISSNHQFHYPTYIHEQSRYSTIPEDQLTDNAGEVVESDNIDRYNPRPYFVPYSSNQNNPDPVQSTGDTNIKTPNIVYDSGPPSPPAAKPQTIYNSPPKINSNDDASISYTPPPSEDANNNDNKASEMEMPKTEEQSSYLVDSYNPPHTGPINDESQLPPDFDGYYYPPLEKPTASSTEMAKPMKMSEKPQNDDHFYPSMVIMDDTGHKDMQPTQMEHHEHHMSPIEYIDEMAQKPAYPAHQHTPKLPEYLEYNPNMHGDMPANHPEPESHGPQMMMPPPPPTENHPEKPKYGDYGVVPDYPPKNSHPYEYSPYHDVEHSTTTPKPMDNEQRVNKKPYSYYYLGRKLWYIPLYFSLYFIIYIFALIVKSILRHKVKFPNEHDWNDFRKERSNNYNGMEIMNTVTEHVWKAIDTSSEQFVM